ncbi:MAG TPA: 50S ribosomal protein L13 [Candidatus Pacearchaeota archaeon]|nr:50S ribosomal protein L13 [Candidatus Pacearchaeota archaeon]
MKRETYTIDATGKTLGEISTKIVTLLRGKNKENFLPYKDNGAFVVVKNIRKIKISGRKLDQKIYYHHSGYLGGLKETSLKEMLEKNPEKALKNSVLGMLPKNKLRAKQIKRLKIIV